MKYCYKCGNQMEDDMLFCQKCGAKVIDTAGNMPEDDIPANTEMADWHAHNNLRKGMKIAMIVCIILAAFYGVAGFAMKQPNAGAELVVGFAVLAAMFFVLAKSPKEIPFILGKQSGLKKSVFVLICVAVFFIICGIGSAAVRNADVSENGINVSDTAASLDDVQKWYENQMPAVKQELPEYAKSVDDISDINVDSSRFFFGGDWNDCYYKFGFTCKINGATHTGEARAFLKYNDDDVKWFSFEIFSNDSIQSVVEVYDDSYDKIIEDYYKELEAEYK